MEMIIANEIIHLLEVIGAVMLIAVKVRTTLYTSNRLINIQFKL